MRYYYALGSAAAHDRAVAELDRGSTAAPPAAYVVLRPAQSYDLSTPGTPAGILAVARAADAGGAWTHRATFALATSADGTEVVASLALRLQADIPSLRRAWVAYVRRQAEGGAAAWRPAGAGLLDAGDSARPLRPIGVEELKATLRGVPWCPPPPRPAAPKLQCQGCDRVVPFALSTWRPYASHRCVTTTGTEGRS